MWTQYYRFGVREQPESNAIHSLMSTMSQYVTAITIRALEISTQANMKVVLDTPPKNENSQVVALDDCVKSRIE